MDMCFAKSVSQFSDGIEDRVVVGSLDLNQSITDMYVHVTVANEAAQRLYMKSGFEQETAEPAWQARYLNRPQRLLLWLRLSSSSLELILSFLLPMDALRFLPLLSFGSKIMRKKYPGLVLP
ncbi:hypothetical protein ARALYDRAFT_891550 [Arabidopsis lyrata subsp. lyrata]|uniref:N-acetyltransferase domain-containing protein n=1 Tax=Arabidopsis lyrata subsp. lyrata TaxID=81972 RepID=D7KAV5_ARALL|nr:hypothetical protein ARALYDRAFT_891550 [Arabidopsis lyrata subsp. lyrata]